MIRKPTIEKPAITLLVQTAITFRIEKKKGEQATPTASGPGRTLVPQAHYPVSNAIEEGAMTCSQSWQRIGRKSKPSSHA
jgi:hypothetical protein